MVERGLVESERVWFGDTRSPVRRMAVACHPEQQLIVLSLWQGDTCTGTFRLPLADGARLIGAVAGGMAAALPDPSTDPVGPPPPGRGGLRATVAAWIRRQPPPPRLRLLR